MKNNEETKRSISSMTVKELEDLLAAEIEGEVELTSEELDEISEALYKADCALDSDDEWEYVGTYTPGNKEEEDAVIERLLDMTD